MGNPVMTERIRTGAAIDVSACERTEDGDYIVPPELWETIDTTGADICDAVEDTWIWSVGENEDTGQIVASTAMQKFYERPGWKCLWLR